MYFGKMFLIDTRCSKIRSFQTLVLDFYKPLYGLRLGHTDERICTGGKTVKFAEYGPPVTKCISSATQSSHDWHVEPGS